MQTVTATVLIVTYNHAKYVADAIRSALMQITDFSFEIIISEDASSDETRDVVLSFAARNPGIIRLLLSETNIRSNEVVARGLRAAKGEYIALLDGDDYWISPRKLARQVHFLSTHPDFSACFHNVLVAEGNRVTTRRWTLSQKPISTLDDMWHGNPFATCSSMLRAKHVRNAPAWYSEFFPITDWPLYILCAEQGRIAYCDEVMGVYRIHGGGLFSALTPDVKMSSVADFYARIDRCLDYKYSEPIRAACSRYFLDWAAEYRRDGNYRLARSCLQRCVTCGGVRSGIGGSQFLKMLWRVLAQR